MCHCFFSVVFCMQYQPEESVAGHLLFALKDESLNLGILKTLLNGCNQRELEQWISENPQGQQTRRAWFLPAAVIAIAETGRGQ